MSAETTGPGATTPRRANWRSWLGVAGAAVGLLVVSEAVWLWQTWPVRELLYSPLTALPARPAQAR